MLLRRNLKPIITLVILTLVSGAIACALYPRPRLLLQQAKPFLPYNTPLPPTFYEGFAWLSGETLLLAQGKAYPNIHPWFGDYSPRPTRDDGQYCEHSLWEYSTITHTRRKLGLSALYNYGLNLYHKELGDFCISPNGRWMFWTENDSIHIGDGNKPTGTLRCASLDGRTTFVFPSDLQGWLLWTPDSHFCLSVNNDWLESKRSICFYSMTARKRTKTIFFSNELEQAPHRAEFWKGAMLQSSTHLLLPIRASLPTSDGEPDNQFVPYASIYELSLTDKVHLSAMHTVKMPEGSCLRDALVAPDGRRVAWVCEFSHTSPALTWLHRLFPAASVAPTRSYEIWLSGINGENMRRLGIMDITRHQDALEAPTEVRWLLGGRYLSFAYRNALWRLTVE